MAELDVEGGFIITIGTRGTGWRLPINCLDAGSDPGRGPVIVCDNYPSG